MKKNEKPTRDPKTTGEAGLGGMLSGLTGLLDKLNELAQSGGELHRSGEFNGPGKGTKGIYGFTIKTGLGGDTPKVEPFGNLRTDHTTGKTVVQELREPPADLFEEADHVLIVVEMPGIGAKDVKLEVAGDVLTLSAAHKDKRYRKEILLPGPYPRDKMRVTCNNGVIEIQCYP